MWPSCVEVADDGNGIATHRAVQRVGRQADPAHGFDPDRSSRARGEPLQVIRAFGISRQTRWCDPNITASTKPCSRTRAVISDLGTVKTEVAIELR
jgi:hypothetical protein